MHEVTDEDAANLEARLKVVADQWRQRLADPATQALIKSGAMTVSPLVKELLATFPPEK
jgi:hypothetical protein